MTAVATQNPTPLLDAGGGTSVLPRPSRSLDRRGAVMPWARAVAAGRLAEALERDFNHVPQPASPAEFAVECVDVSDEAPGVRTVSLRRTDGRALGHRPGQYVRLVLPLAGRDAEPLERCYSISTTPVRGADGLSPAAEVFAVTVKRQPCGLGSNWIHDVLSPGMVLEAQGPLGGFHLPDFDRRARYLLLAAGAGITPIMSMVRTLATLPGVLNAVVIYHCSRPEDFAFAAELQRLAACRAGLTVLFSLGDGLSAEPGSAGWTGLRGRICREMLDEIVADACGRQVYACGPSGYLQTVRHAVADAGVARNWYFEESFDSAAHDGDRMPQRWNKPRFVEPGGADSARMDALFMGPSAPPRVRAVPEAGARETTAPQCMVSEATAPETTTERPTVTFVRSGATVAVADGESLLDAGRRVGVPLKSNCRTGACGTCKVAKLVGRVDMEHGGGIRQREVDAGKILLCCSTPDGDVSVDG